MDQMMTAEPDESLAEDPLMVLSQDVLVVLILMGITALVGLIGNLIFVRALCMYRNLRVDVFVIMGGLAVADMLHLVIAVPSHMMDILRVLGVMSTSWCKCSRYLMNGTSYIAAYHLVVMTVLRGILLTNRGHSSPTGRHALYCSIVVWVVGALATVPVIQVWVQEDDVCLYTQDADIDKELWLTSSFSCFVPITMMLLIYATTYYIGKRYFADSYSRHEKQMSRLVSAVVLSFVICELPHHVTTLVYNNAYDHPDDDYIKNLSVINDYFLCLLLVDKAIRPVLYSKLSTDLGDCFDEVINCTYCHRYYSDGPRRQKSDKSAASTAPLTTEQPADVSCEEVV